MLEKKIARIISEISNGFLTMILTPVLAIIVNPVETYKKVVYISLYILITIFPYLILHKVGMVSDYEFTNRKERPPYFITISILFGIIYFLLRQEGLETLTNISLNLFLVSSVITLITFFWKISGHMTYSTILFITLIYLFPSSPSLYLLFIFTPFIGWSRIVLQKHTLTQVSLGTMLTLAISILIYWGF